MNSERDDESSAGSEEPQFPSDPELDVRSEQFNPLKALYSDQMFSPYKKVPLYDNLAMFEAAMRKQEINEQNAARRQAGAQQSSEEASAGPSGSASSRWLKDELDVVARRFQPHQGSFIRYSMV